MSSSEQVPLSTGPNRCWSFGDRRWLPGDLPKIMGILNVTPDSFSDGGLWSTVEKGVEQGLQLIQQGADILDIGGESTRPGADPVTEDEELRRVIPVIENLSRQSSVPISIDTMKARVAREAIAAGGVIVNDVTAGTFDDNMFPVCAESNCGLILMHMLGSPQTMQADPQYEDVVRDVAEYLEQRLQQAVAAGIAAERIAFDPGIGFGKTADHNVQLLQNISLFRRSGRPVLIGHSRKRFLAKVVGRPVEERLAGTIGVAIGVAQQHADILRVHDVAAVRDALLAWKAVLPPQDSH